MTERTYTYEAIPPKYAVAKCLRLHPRAHFFFPKSKPRPTCPVCGHALERTSRFYTGTFYEVVAGELTGRTARTLDEGTSTVPEGMVRTKSGALISRAMADRFEKLGIEP